MKIKLSHKLFFRLLQVFVVFAIFSCSNLFSQQQPQAAANTGQQQQQENKQTQPIELPNFIIEGKEQLNVRTGVKQFPTRTAPLTSIELDSINTIQKQQAILLPPKSMPAMIFNNAYQKGYLFANIGNYMSANVQAGYEIKDNEYSFFGNGFVDYTDGHLKNSGYTNAGLDLQVDYIAPKKFWIFGGSKTRANFDIKMDNFKLYALPTATERKAHLINLAVESEGEFEGYKFFTGAGFKRLSLEHKNADLFDNAFSGQIQLRKETSDFEFKLGSEVQFHGISGDASNYLNLGGGLKINLNDMTFDLSGSFQSVGATDGVQRGNIAVNFAYDYRINKLFTLKAVLDVGFDNDHLFELFDMNRYIETKPLIDFTYHRNITGRINYHPDMNITASAGFKVGGNDRFKYFEIDTTAQFKLNYASAQDVEIFADIAYNLSDYDNIFGGINFKSVTFSDSLSNKVPFIPALKLRAYYERKWSKEFGTQIGVEYFGSRYCDYQNNRELDGFINLNLKIDYKLNDYLKICGKIDNLINSEIYLWENYKEREIFISAGIMWQF